MDVTKLPDKQTVMSDVLDVLVKHGLPNNVAIEVLVCTAISISEHIGIGSRKGMIKLVNLLYDSKQY